MRFELLQGDRWPAAGNNSAARAELAASDKNAPQPVEPAGAERWYGFSIYLPGADEIYLPDGQKNREQWQDDKSPEGLVQWHQKDDNDSPPLQIVTHAGKWKISQRAWGDPNKTKYVWEDPNHYETGRWVDWVVHVKWGGGLTDDPDLTDSFSLDDPSAFLHIWKDGEPVFSSPGKKNAYVGQGNYFKLGIYKWDWSRGRPSDTARRVVYLDEVRIADASGSYEMVAPPLTCSDGFGNLADGRPLWTGDFNGDGKAELLFYYPGDNNWRLGTFHGEQINWSLAGDTAGFGNVEKLPFWTGNFSRADRTELLFYSPNDGNWWLGTHDGVTIQWSVAGNTSGANAGDPDFGNVANDSLWVGDFNGNGRADVLFYAPQDGNWWLGSYEGNALGWSLAGNTSGANAGDHDFGNIAKRPLWTGNFNGDGRANILVYTPSDGNWWLGTHDGNALQWSSAGNTTHFGNSLKDKTVWVGNFSRADRMEVLFYYAGDGNWWLGTHDGSALQWSLAGNTTQYGNALDGKTFWVGDFNGDGRADLLFNYNGDGNWWQGSHDGNQFQWSSAGNTTALGNSLNGKTFWVGNFSRADRAELLFNFKDDGNWLLGRFDGAQTSWGLANAGRKPLSDMVAFRQKVPDLNGWVEASLCRDGTVQIRGHAHDDGIQSVSFRVITIVRTASFSIAKVYEGHVGGAGIGSNDSRNEDWLETFEHPLVSSRFGELENATFEVKVETRGDITGWLEDVGTFLTRFVVGTLLVNNPILGCAVVVVGVVALAKIGGFDTGARVIGSTLWLAGPQGTLFALIFEGVVALGSEEHELPLDVYDWANTEIFAGTLPPRERIILTDTVGLNDRPFVFPRYDGKITVNVGPKVFANPLNFKYVLAHELVHTWQLHNLYSDLGYLGIAIPLQVCNFLGANSYDVAGVDGTQNFADLNLEQQAEVVEVWFNTLPANRSTHKFNRYIVENIRTGSA